MPSDSKRGANERRDIRPEPREIIKDADPGCPICGAVVSIIGGFRVCGNGHRLYVFGMYDGRSRYFGRVMPLPGTDSQQGQDIEELAYKRWPHRRRRPLTGEDP